MRHSTVLKTFGFFSFAALLCVCASPLQGQAQAAKQKPKPRVVHIAAGVAAKIRATPNGGPTSRIPRPTADLVARNSVAVTGSDGKVHMERKKPVTK
jgi:hypothetical protein